MESVPSRTNIRAVHAGLPPVANENVIVLAPSFRSSAFCKCTVKEMEATAREIERYQLIRREPERLCIPFLDLRLRRNGYGHGFSDR